MAKPRKKQFIGATDPAEFELGQLEKAKPAKQAPKVKPMKSVLKRIKKKYPGRKIRIAADY